MQADPATRATESSESNTRGTPRGKCMMMFLMCPPNLEAGRAGGRSDDPLLLRLTRQQPFGRVRILRTRIAPSIGRSGVSKKCPMLRIARLLVVSTNPLVRRQQATTSAAGEMRERWSLQEEQAFDQPIPAIKRPKAPPHDWLAEILVAPNRGKVSVASTGQAPKTETVSD